MDKSQRALGDVQGARTLLTSAYRQLDDGVGVPPGSYPFAYPSLPTGAPGPEPQVAGSQ